MANGVDRAKWEEKADELAREFETRSKVKASRLWTYPRTGASAQGACPRLMKTVLRR